MGFNLDTHSEETTGDRVMLTLEQATKAQKGSRGINGNRIRFANSQPCASFIKNLYQLDKQSTKFTIWKY